MSSSSSANALPQLRQLMVDSGVDYYYVPTRDDHNNEYVPPFWQRRDWLTGFTGSYGQALVGLHEAYLWTDPRYFLQAEQELDANYFRLMKQMQGVAAPISGWLADHAHNCVVAVDPRVISIREYRQWSDALLKVGSEFKPLKINLVDEIWTDRPSLDLTEVQILPEVYAGLAAQDKLDRVREVMQKNNVNTLVLTMLDEIAWLFNLRASDIPFNPLIISYAIVTNQEAILFTELSRVSDEVKAYCASQNILVKPYDSFAPLLENSVDIVWVDPATASLWVLSLLQKATVFEKTSPVIMMKAIKNEVEVAGAFEAHRLDALAVVKFLHWLEMNWQSGVNEVSAADKLETFRREDSRCKDLSFNTICGFADHGAIVHYAASPETAYAINDSNLLLVDSGGQYFEGTTDITRTMHLGVPTQAQKKHYTLVLKGHLALRHAIFPKGVSGEQLNALARLPLWEQGLDFGHGTGHGVGSYLCVHEGPQRISYGATGVPLMPGMIVSNEPGFYLGGQYGIRIENLCVIQEKFQQADSLTGDGPFYTMQDLTLVPYALNLIDKTLLSDQEITWVNAYHQKVYDALIEDLDGDVKDWLQAATQPL